MLAAKASPHPPQSARRKALVWVTLLVALAHLALLSGLPDMMSAFQGDAAQSTRSFATRTIAPEPVAEPAPPKPPVATKPPPAKPAAAKPVPPPEVPPDAAQDASVAPASDGQATAPAPDTATATNSDTTSDSGTTSGAVTPPTTSASAPVDSAASTAPPEPPRKLVIPPSVRLVYDVKGVVTYAYTGGGELLWLNQGDSYNARFQITKFGFNLRTWTSKGGMGLQGLEPLRFGDRTRSEVAAHFQREKGIVSFSANSPDVPLLTGAQDQLSSFFQLAGMLAGEPERYPAGSLIAFQVVNARSAESWVFKVDGAEPTELPDGPKAAIKLTREHDAQYDTKVELWLAPDLAFVPIRIRLSQGNGDFAELLWRSAHKPE